MRRRTVHGTLGAPVEHGIPVVPKRWRLAALIAVVAICVAVFLTAIVFGLRSA